MPKKSKKGKAKKRKRQRRYHGVEILAGYRGRDNSFTLRVIINTHRPINKYSSDQIADLVEKLAQQGHFDSSPNNPSADLRWVFFNDWEIVRSEVRIGRGKARLVDFYRSSPASLP